MLPEREQPIIDHDVAHALLRARRLTVAIDRFREVDERLKKNDNQSLTRAVLFEREDGKYIEDIDYTPDLRNALANIIVNEWNGLHQMGFPSFAETITKRHP